MTLGLPTSMFLVFLATVLAGSLGAIHYVIVHVVLDRPFAEVPPPVLAKRGPDSAGARSGRSDPGAERASEGSGSGSAEGHAEAGDEAGGDGDGVVADEQDSG